MGSLPYRLTLGHPDKFFEGARDQKLRQSEQSLGIGLVVIVLKGSNLC